jgi:hypothetical protein
MSAANRVPDQDIAAWRATGHSYKLIAAAMTEWAREQERGSAVPENTYFANRLPVVASPSVYKRARKFLVTQGVLWRTDGPCMVA